MMARISTPSLSLSEPISMGWAAFVPGSILFQQQYIWTQQGGEGGENCLEDEDGSAIDMECMEGEEGSCKWGSSVCLEDVDGNAIDVEYRVGEMGSGQWGSPVHKPYA